MKKPGLHYFKRNSAELPEGYRKPIKRRRKPPPVEIERIIIPVKMKAKPVIRRRTPRGRLMPLRMKNEWIPRGADWCQINGQKVRQDIFFGEVVGRVFIPGLFTGEACGSCGPSMLDFGGGCGDGGCDGGCDGGGGGGGGGGEGDGCASAGCEGEGCGTGGAACEGCAGCEGEGCASAGCASAGCESAGCESSGCAVDGCAGCASCADSGCDTGGPTGGGGCDTGCTGCAGEGCGGCEAAGCTGCADTGCDTGCGMGCDAGCAATGCVDTGCGMGCVAPASDFGSWGPTAGVDYTGGQAGWGQAGWGAPSNSGMNNAIGPPGWATGDFGVQAIGGPIGTGLGPGSTSISTPTGSTAPGVVGFPGDFGAPVGGAIGMSGNVGTQAGPGMFGGPGSVQQGEGLGPTGFGIAPAAPAPGPSVAPGERSDIAPSQNFGPETAANTGFFGVGQAQAADRGTDALAAQMQSAPTTSTPGLEGTFASVTAAANALAQSNPALAEALSQAAANMQAPGLAPPGQLGPGMTGFEGVTPGAQQGFTGVSNAQNSPNSFTSFSDARGFDPSSRADPQDLPHGQVGPGFDLANPNVTPGQQDFVAGKTGTIADDFNTRSDVTLRGSDLLSPTEMQQLMTDFGPNYGPQAPSNLAPAGQIGPSITDLNPHGQIGPGFVLSDPNPTPFGNPARGSQDDPDVPPAEDQTIALSRGQDVISSLDPATRGVGREAAPLGLLDMLSAPSRGSPVGNPYQAGSQFTGGRSGSQGQSGRGSSRGGSFGEFGPSAGRGGRGETAGRSLSITVGGRGAPAAGYYNTGGRGIAPGAKGAEYGGIYGPGVATGRAGTNTFGVDSRSGAYGYYDPATGLYYTR